MKEMRWTGHMTHVGYIRREYKSFWWINLKGSDHSGDLVLNGSVLLTWIFGICLIWLFWLRIGTSGWLFLEDTGFLSFHEMRDILWVPEPLLASQAGLCFVKFCGLRKVIRSITLQMLANLNAVLQLRCLDIVLSCGGQVALWQSLFEFCGFPCQLLH
jgi:hypothetical protein